MTSLRDAKSPALIVSTGPHWHIGASIPARAGQVALALLPAAAFAVYVYGMHAARVIALAIASAMVAELLTQRLFKRPVTLHDGSAILTGLLLALLLPASAPYWLVIVASVVAVIIGKQVFGGRGANPLNAALVGWAAARLSWPLFTNLDLALVTYDLDFSVRAPLMLLRSGGVAALEGLSHVDLFLGLQVGGLGSTSGLLLLIGGLFAVARGVVSWRIPLAFLLGLVSTAGLMWLANPETWASPLFHLVAGNTMIGALFLATDDASSPNNRWSQLLFGLGCGALTVLFRAWSAYPDGVCFAVLVMNVTAPLLDRIGAVPRPSNHLAGEVMS